MATARPWLHQGQNAHPALHSCHSHWSPPEDQVDTGVWRKMKKRNFQSCNESKSADVIQESQEMVIVFPWLLSFQKPDGYLFHPCRGRSASLGARKATWRTARPSVSVWFFPRPVNAKHLRCQVLDTILKIREQTSKCWWLFNPPETSWPTRTHKYIQPRVIHRMLWQQVAPAKRAFFLSSTPAACLRDSTAQDGLLSDHYHLLSILDETEPGTRA